MTTRIKSGLFLLLIVMLTSVTWLYRFQVEDLRHLVEGELTAISQFKAQQIADWKISNLDDASVLQRNLFLKAVEDGFLKNPTTNNLHELADRLDLLAEVQGFTNILLIDSEGKELMRLKQGCLLQFDRLSSYMETAAATRKPVFVDLHNHSDGSPPHTSIIVPLFHDADVNSQLSGFLLMVNNAADFLFPLLDSWPTQSASAETLLVRREGDQAVILNVPRNSSEIGHSLRLPLSAMNEVAVMAAVGRQGYVEGRDYRDAKVAAVLMPVAHTTWSLVVKKDFKEAFAHWPYHVAFPVTLLVFLITLIAVSWLFFWKSEQKAQLEALNQIEQDRRAALEHEALLLRSIIDGIIATDSDGRVILINTAAEQMTGWTEEAANGHRITEVFTLVDVRTGEAQPHLVQEALATNRPICLSLAGHVLLVTKDGQQYHVTFSIAPVDVSANRLGGSILIFRDVSESYRLREAIRQERDLFQLFIDQVPVAIAMFDRQMCYLAASKRYMEDFKLGDRDIIGRSHYEVLPSITGRSEMHQRVLGGVVESAEEDAIRWSDGKTDWVQWAMHPWYESSGEVGGLVFFCEVITARKKAELALEASKDRLNHLLSVSPVVIYSLQADTFTPTWVSPNVVDLLGYTTDEVLQPSWFSTHLYGADQDQMLADSQAFRDANHRVREYRFYCKDGSVRWIRDELRLLHDEQGEPAEIVGAWMDITQRREIEDALERSEATFRTIFEKHSAVKLLIDPSDGRILDANEAAATFYGWPREELQNMNVHDINTLSSEQIAAEMEKVFRNEQVRFKFRHRLADGSARDVEVFCSGIEIQGRMVLHTISQDITRRRQLEEQLRQSQKMESIGLLAGGVAHEFNNMLAVIIGYCQFALDRATADNPLHDDLREILRAANHSAQITRQLLAFAQQQTTETKKFNVNTAVSELLGMLGKLIGEQIELTWHPGNCELPVLMDPTQFNQILINLCLNARDAIASTGTITIATSIGSGQFDACCGAACEFDRYAVLSVSDNGCGMDQATRERIFEPFFTTKDPGKGTGLGLSMVYGSIQQSGGFIDVKSTPGEGTTFTLFLPLTEMNLRPLEAADVPEPTKNGATILLVEDDPSVLRMAQLMITDLGYQVLAVDSPEEAIQLVRSHGDRVDMLVTDMIMPKMNGAELAATLQAVLPGLKVLFISGYAPGGLSIPGNESQEICFLQKPFGIKELESKIWKVLQ
ncbi:MAG: PAS domain S-box protein [Desulfobulbus oligotrophicus]|nr:PAS domain S-box protein [Desulfobulbus oligotrophicus]